MTDWRKTRAYRQWRILTIRRDKVCQVCGSMRHRQAHHLNSGSYHPDERYDTDNGITLCKFHHTLFHTSYMFSFRQKCTKKHYLNFVELLDKLKARGLS